MEDENEAIDNEDTSPGSDTDVEQSGGDTASAGNEGGAEDDKRSLEEKGLDAFNEGTEAVKGKRDDADIPSPKEKTAGDAAGKERPAATKPGAKGDPGHAQQPKTAEKPKDADVQKEVDALGLKGKAADRFHEMASTIKSHSEMDRVLKNVGCDNPKVLDQVLVDAARGLAWEEEIMKSTASPDQLKNALVVVHAINSKNPQLMNIAFDQLSKEVNLLGQELGRSNGEGGADPLANHPDLQKSVEAMDITREHALEIARHRANATIEQTRQQTISKQNEARANQAKAQEQEAKQSFDALEQLDAEYKATDPHYAYKMKVLQENGTFGEIGKLPPAQREPAVRVAWRNVPNPVPVQQRVRPGHVSTRTNGAPAGGDLRAQKTFKSDYDAFSAGVLSVTPGGG